MESYIMNCLKEESRIITNTYLSSNGIVLLKLMEEYQELSTCERETRDYIKKVVWNNYGYVDED